MKRILLIVFLMISNLFYSQSNEDLNKLDNEMILSSINLVCSSLNEPGKTTFNCYEKNNNVCCDIDVYTDFEYDSNRNKLIDKVLVNFSKDLIFNRIVMPLKKSETFEFIEKLKSKYSFIHFKIRFNTLDGTILKYVYYIDIKEVRNMLSYLNKDDFFEILYNDKIE